MRLSSTITCMAVCRDNQLPLVRPILPSLSDLDDVDHTNGCTIHCSIRNTSTYITTEHKISTLKGAAISKIVYRVGRREKSQKSRCFHFSSHRDLVAPVPETPRRRQRARLTTRRTDRKRGIRGMTGGRSTNG